METRCCPTMSKDANGSTGLIRIRFFLMQLALPMPYSAKTQREGEIEMKSFYFIHFMCKPFVSLLSNKKTKGCLVYKKVRKNG